MRKKYLTVRVTEYSNRLHSAAMESPSLEVFKISLDMCKLLQRTCSIRDVGLDDHKRSVPTSTTMWFCNFTLNTDKMLWEQTQGEKSSLPRQICHGVQSQPGSWANPWERVLLTAMILAVIPNKARLMVRIRTLITNHLTPVNPGAAPVIRKQIRGDLEQILHVLWFCKCLLDHRSKNTISHWPVGHSSRFTLVNTKFTAQGIWWLMVLNCWCAWITDGLIEIVLRPGTKQAVGLRQSLCSFWNLSLSYQVMSEGTLVLFYFAYPLTNHNLKCNENVILIFLLRYTKEGWFWFSLLFFFVVLCKHWKYLKLEPNTQTRSKQT